MRILIIWYCILFLSCAAIGQQQEAIFYSELDTLYQMVDPNITIHSEPDDELHWNFSEAQSPCYHEIIVDKIGENKLEFKRSDGTSFFFRKQGEDALILDSYHGHDPFFNVADTRVKYRGNYYLLKYGHQLHDQFNSILSLRYEIDKPVYLDSISEFDGVGKLRINAGKQVKAHVEDQGRLYLPIGNSNCTLVSYEVRDYVNSVELLIDGNWRKANSTEREKLRAYTKDRFYFMSRYFGSEAPYIIAQLKQNNKNVPQSFDFFDSEKPSVISSCEQDGVSIFLYPNPSFGVVKVQFINQEPDDYSIVVYNIIGKPLIRRSLKTEKPNEIIPVNFGDIQRGTYLYGILDGTGKRILSKKLIILSI